VRYRRDLGWCAWGVYQGRDHFEGGEEGVKYDIRRGMEGYDDGAFLADVFK